MTAAAARLLSPRALAAAGAFVIAAGLGVLAGYAPALAIAGAFGLAFGLLAFADLALGAAIFGFLTFLELVPTTAGGTLSLPKLAGLTIAVSWIAAASSEKHHDRWLFSRHAGLTLAVVFFLSWVALSGLWAEDPGRTWTALGRYALNAALIPIVYTAIREPRHLRWIVGGLIAGAAVAAGYGLITAPNLSGAATSLTPAGDLGRVSGTIGDPNQLAVVLVVGVVMSFAVGLDVTRSLMIRALAIGSALVCLIGIFATLSRGGIVALGVAMLAWLLLAGPRRGRVALITTLALFAAVGYFGLVANQAQIDRLTTSDGGTGRTDIWKVGWRMVEANPLDGVGAGNFSLSSIHYLLVDPGAIERAEFIVDTPKVAHNMYLEVLAELGIPGLIMFLAFIALCLRAAIRAAQTFERLGDDGLALIARGVAVALVSTLAADFFLSEEYNKLLWLLLGLGPALLAVARSAALSPD